MLLFSFALLLFGRKGSIRLQDVCEFVTFAQNTRSIVLACRDGAGVSAGQWLRERVSSRERKCAMRKAADPLRAPHSVRVFPESPTPNYIITNI